MSVLLLKIGLLMEILIIYIWKLKMRTQVR
jgi:hypothetical protein